MQVQRIHFSFRTIAMHPKVATAFWECPLGKEYPSAPARADSTMVKSGFLTYGRGILHASLSAWLITVPMNPVQRI